MNNGLKSKLFSCRNLAFKVSLPVMLLTCAEFNTSPLPGSDIFTNRTLARRAISSLGWELLVLLFCAIVSGLAVQPYEPRTFKTLSHRVPLPLRVLAPYRMIMHSCLVSPVRPYPNIFWRNFVFSISPDIISKIKLSHLSLWALESNTTFEILVNLSELLCSWQVRFLTSSVPFLQLKIYGSLSNSDIEIGW